MLMMMVMLVLITRMGMIMNCLRPYFFRLFSPGDDDGDAHNKYDYDDEYDNHDDDEYDDE